MTAKIILKYSDETVDETIELREQGVTYAAIKVHFKKKGIVINIGSLRSRVRFKQKGLSHATTAETIAVTDDANKQHWQSILYNPVLSYVA